MLSLHDFRYVCGWSGSANARGPYVTGAPLARARGDLIARTVDQALWDCDGWPARLYEVRALPGELFGATEHLARARALEVVRELPLAEALGPRATEVIALLDDLPRGRWLARPARLDESRVVALVA